MGFFKAFHKVARVVNSGYARWGKMQYAQIQAGQARPEFEDRHGKKHRACWSLLEREDIGSAFDVEPDTDG